MIHQFRDKKQIASKKRKIKNLFFLIFLLSLSAGGVFAYLGGVMHFIGRSFWQTKESVIDNFEEVGYITRSKASVYKENENILKENSLMKVSMLDYDILKNENLSLKELFGRVPLDKDLVVTNILTKPNYSPYDTIVIDIGNNNGISVGDKVYANVVTPIGEVSVVYINTSLVTLYSNPGKVTEAMIEGENTSIELIGRGGGNFEMMIPIDLPFTNGSFVFLPNITSEIVAITEDVISSPNDPIKKVLLSSPVNVQNLKWVFVSR